MKKKMMKLTAVLFAMVMLLGISVVVFADGETPVDIGPNNPEIVAYIPTDPAIFDPANLIYNGQPKTPPVIITHNGSLLIQDVHYRLDYGTNNINAGLAYIKVIGIGNYTGERDIPYTIEKASQTLTLSFKPGTKIQVKKSKRVTVSSTAGDANMGALTFKTSKKSVATITGKGLVKGVKPGKVTITVNAAGSQNYFPATAAVEIQIKGLGLTKKTTKLTLSKTSYTYDGSYKKPSVTVKYKGKKLKRGRDYKVTYEKNKNAGKAYLVVTGAGQYDESQKKAFTIKKAKNTLTATIDDSTIEMGDTAVIKAKKAIGKVTYKSSNTSVATVSEDGVVKGKKSGSVSITVTAAGDKNHEKGKKVIKVTVGSLNLSDAKVNLSNSTYTYDGNSKKPSVSVTISGKKLKSGRDYSVTYYDNVNAGKARVVVSAKGRYRGSRTLTFRINKAKQKNLKISFADGYDYIPVGGKARVVVSGGRGSLSYGSNSPSYARSLGDGWFQGLKATQDHISIYVTAAGDDNYEKTTATMDVKVK